MSFVSSHDPWADELSVGGKNYVEYLEKKKEKVTVSLFGKEKPSHSTF